MCPNDSEYEDRGTDRSGGTRKSKNPTVGQLENSLGAVEGGGGWPRISEMVQRRESKLVRFRIEGSATGEKNSQGSLKAVPYTRSAVLYFKSLLTAAQQHQWEVFDPTVGFGLGTQRTFWMAVKSCN